MKKKLMMILLLLFGALLLLILFIAFILLSKSDRSLLLQSTHTYDYKGSSRSYIIRSPKSVTSETAVVVGLHGFSGDAKMFAYYTGLQNALPDNDIIIMPQAVKAQTGQKLGWNAGFCCGSGWMQKSPDAEFIMDLVEDIKKQYSAMDAKIFVVGFSNGAFMAQKLATDYPDRIDAIVSGSGTIGTEKFVLKPESAVPILLMHGEKDARVNFNGGSSNNDPDFVWKSHEETVDTWKKNNENIAPVVSITYPEDSHKWHDWRLFNIWHKKPQGSVEAAEFLNNHR